MPVLDGVRATARLVAEGSSTRVLVLTTYDADDLVHRALRAGAAGFLLKSVPADRLAEGADGSRRARRCSPPRSPGGSSSTTPTVPPPGTRRACAACSSTAREADVLTLVARGMSNDDIAAELVVSTATVKTHVNRGSRSWAWPAAPRPSSPPTSAGWWCRGRAASTTRSVRTSQPDGPDGRR